MSGTFIRLDPPQYSRVEDWLNKVWIRLGGGRNNIVYVPTFAKAALPSAIEPAGIIYVSDEAGGATIAFSDGTSWRRVSDRAVVS
jgi:hypothetical protein